MNNISYVIFNNTNRYIRPTENIDGRYEVDDILDCKHFSTLNSAQTAMDCTQILAPSGDYVIHRFYCSTVVTDHRCQKNIKNIGEKLKSLNLRKKSAVNIISLFRTYPKQRYLILFTTANIPTDEFCDNASLNKNYLYWIGEFYDTSNLYAILCSDITPLIIFKLKSSEQFVALIYDRELDEWLNNYADL